MTLPEHKNLFSDSLRGSFNCVYWAASDIQSRTQRNCVGDVHGVHGVIYVEADLRNIRRMQDISTLCVGLVLEYLREHTTRHAVTERLTLETTGLFAIK